MHMSRIGRYAAGTVLLLLVAACGSGGGGDGNAGNPDVIAGSDVPASAVANPEGWVGYLRSLITERTDETSEPVLVGDITAPTSETLEPLPVQ